MSVVLSKHGHGPYSAQHWPCSPCWVCNPRMAYIPSDYWALSPSSPSSDSGSVPAYPLFTAGPPVSAWSSPRTTVMEYPNARVRVDWYPRAPRWGWGFY